MRTPAAEKPVGTAGFTSPIEGLCTPGTVTVDWAVTAAPVGGVPVAVPVLVMWPRSTSVWLVVTLAVQVSLAAGASVVVGQVMAVSRGAGSVTPTAVRVTLPV